jgi:hypothetical protein
MIRKKNNTFIDKLTHLKTKKVKRSINKWKKESYNFNAGI